MHGEQPTLIIGDELVDQFETSVVPDRVDEQPDLLLVVFAHAFIDGTMSATPSLILAASRSPSNRRCVPWS
jgi:hypothetical protein